MTQFIISFLAVSLVMSAVILAVLTFNALCPNVLTAKLRYAVWITILLGIIIPLRPVIGGGFVKVSYPESIQQPDDSSMLPVSETSQGADSMQEAAGTDRRSSTISGWPVSPITICGIIWVIAAVIIFLYNIWKYVRFFRMIRRFCIPVKDERILSLFHSVQVQCMHRGQKISLKVCDFISSSMLTGFLHPVILLPKKDFDEDELELIFRHELIHYKRHDLYIKLLSLIAVSIHWFNPAVYLMCRAMQAEGEASCDEAVLKDAGLESRQFYAEVIIGMISTKNTAGTILSTCFYGGKSSIKRRLSSIMDPTHRMRKPAVIVLALVVALTLFSGSVFAFAQKPSTADINLRETPPAGRITDEQAKSIALSTVGGGTVVGCIVELENSRDIYRIEVIFGDKRYGIDIDAIDSSIVDYKVGAVETASPSNIPDLQAETNTKAPVETGSDSEDSQEITAEQAEEIALGKTGDGTVIECRIGYRDGRKVYEIKIIYNDMNYDMDVDAVNGTVTDYTAEKVNNSTGNTKYHDDDHGHN